MYQETNIRSIAKGVSWRISATTITIIIVYLFFNRIDLAIAAGIIETFLKIILYWWHERIWHKIRWGKKKISPFNLWFTGLPLSGKTTIADIVFKELDKLQMPIERLDSKDIRSLLPNMGFDRKDRNNHITRIGHLIKILQKNSISTVASFVSPYVDSREIIRKMASNTIVVYIKANVDTCKKRDVNKKYEKAMKGEYKNFTGVSDVYEEPKCAEIVIDTDNQSIDEAVKIIVQYVNKHCVK